jgi:hypothetical protein
MDHFMHHGYLVHPDIWMLWAAVILTPVNTIGILFCLRRTRW